MDGGYPKFSNELVESIDRLCLGEKLVVHNSNFKFDILSPLEQIEWQLPSIKIENLNLKDNIFKNFFTLKITDKNLDRVQTLNKDTLFSALISKKITDSDGLNLNLDIPDLPDDVSLLKWQIPNTETYEWVNHTESSEHNDEDEGFFSNKCSPSQKKVYAQIPETLWDEILDFKFSNYSNWDTKSNEERLIIGFNLNQKLELTKPLLIDSTKKIFDYFYYHYLNTINIIIDQKLAFYKLVINPSNFLIDTLNVLLSLPSVSFIYSSSKSKFLFNNQIQISGLSSEALGAFSEEFIQVGTKFRQILDLIKVPRRSQTCGSVFRSYVNAITEYLNLYHIKIIEYFSIVNEMTPLRLYSSLKPMMDQFECLTRIIKLDGFDPDESNSYQKGSDLIFYLFNLARQSSNNDFTYQLCLHLLTSCLDPFFRFIEKWIFEGEFLDKYDEFFIESNQIFAKTNDYFNNAFKLKEKFKELDQSECYFIKSLYEDIFYCGRNLMLLKKCDPDNFLFKTKTFYPKLQANFNESYLNQIEQTCTEYSSYVIKHSKYNLKSRREYLDEQSRLHDLYLTRLQNEAMERFRLYEQQETENRKHEQKLKQERFNFLKEQMEQDLKRRQNEKDKQKQDDKDYMDKLVNRDFEYNQEKKILEQKLKEEIQKEYQDKMRDAEAREKAARDRIEQTTKRIQELETSAMDIEMEEVVEELKPPEPVETSDIEMEISESPVRLKVNDETTEKDYRSSIKLQETQNALTESPSQVYKPSIRLNEKYHPSKQTDLNELDIKEKNRLDWLRSRNIQGHSSNSKIQNYIENYDQQADSLEEQNLQRLKRFEHFTKKEDRVEQINFDEIVKPYQKDYPELDSEINNDYLQSLRESFESPRLKLDTTASLVFNHINLEEIFNRILYKPVQVQLGLVNRSCINYFLFDLKLEDHLAALRKYVLFENGVFAQTFVDELNSRVQQTNYTYMDLEFLLSPIYLREAFEKTRSQIKHCKLVDNLSIRLNLDPKKTSGLLNYLGMIELVYKVEWPLSIVINESTIQMYNQIFSFLLKIKFVLSALNSIWYTLRRYELVYKSEKSFQLKQLKFYCHEMQNYMIALQSYIYNQVIQVTWDDLQKNLNNAKHIDDLIRIHETYIKTAHSRCFFKKTPNVVQVILNTFEIIIKFHLLILNGNLVRNEIIHEYEHEAFGLLTENYQFFKNNAVFLHKILQKGISIGYEYHLNNLALSLNYNYYYGNDTPVV